MSGTSTTSSAVAGAQVPAQPVAWEFSPENEAKFQRNLVVLFQAGSTVIYGVP